MFQEFKTNYLITNSHTQQKHNPTFMFFITTLTPSKWIGIIIVIRHFRQKNDKQGVSFP